MSRRVSVVIPALNEALLLPRLLDRLDSQTLRPYEVIVADAHSTDETAAIAASRGATVVPGGKPGTGRNAGASVATGDLILFFDADVEPPDTFVERAVAEFTERDLDVASAPAEPLEPGRWNSFLCWFCNTYMGLLEHVSPHGSGFCILVRREAHERSGGFDEGVLLAEDHRYVQQVSRIGRFGVLKSVSIPGSMRRADKEGPLRLVRLFAYSEWFTLAGRPIRRLPFRYEFGAFDDKLRRPETTRGCIGRLLRTLRMPSTEIQTDALGALVASVVVGSVGAAVLAMSGLGPEVYASFAGAALAVAGLSTFEVLRKLRYERHYGDFFMASVAVASDDLRTDDGRVLARKGIDEVCELHIIGGLVRMSLLNRRGAAGRLTIVLEALGGLRSMLDDMGDPLYRDVVVVTARSDLVRRLFKMGFDEIGDPPRYDLVNRLQKRVLMTFLRTLTGRDRSARPEDYRMAVIPRQRFTEGAFPAALDRQIDRIVVDLARTRERSKPAVAE